MSERTKQAVGFPGYDVTSRGRVFSNATNWRGYGSRELQQTLTPDGYPRVRLTLNGKRTSMPVHRLVANAFLGPKPTPAHEVRHLDGDKTNNNVENLAWGTRAENAADRESHGKTSRGDRHSAAIRAAIKKARGES